MTLEHGYAAKSAKSIFYEDVNDIDIFIEDTTVGFIKIYTKIFSRLLKDEYRISNVFPLGGRKQVISECEKSQGSSSRPSLYIIDGDLHLLTCEPKLTLPGLYILPFYCIENILVDENAILKVLDEEDINTLTEQLADLFNFDEWVSNNCYPLLNLFIEYATSFTLCPDIKTIKFPINNLVSSNKGVIDELKVERRIQEIKNIILSRHDILKYEKLRKQIASQITFCSDDFLRFISGKDFLLPLIITRLKSIVKTKISNINFKLRLAMNCNLTPLENSKQYIAL